MTELFGSESQLVFPPAFGAERLAPAPGIRILRYKESPDSAARPIVVSPNISVPAGYRTGRSNLEHC